MVDKKVLIAQIIEQLTADLDLSTEAAKRAHEAATHEESIPEDKYDTQGLEASYLAQGHANRAQDVLGAIAAFKSMPINSFTDETPIRISALITLSDESVSDRLFFLGPDAGGMKVQYRGMAITIITPHAPLGRALLGAVVDDEVVIGNRENSKTYVVIAVE